MGRKANTVESVWKFVDRKSDNECWLWMGKTSPSGYGRFSIKHRQVRAHRAAFASANGYFPDLVMHKCDTPRCCNPAHLKAGTNKENTQDMIAKGRRADLRAEKGGRAKLTNECVRRIREACLFGASQKDLAALYGVSRATICTAVSGYYYSVVT